MLVLPPHISGMRPGRKKDRARARWLIDQAMNIADCITLAELSQKLGYHPRTISTILYYGRLTDKTARLLQRLCGKDEAGNWRMPKELVAPDFFGDA